MSNGEQRPLNGEAEEEDDDDDANNGGLAAWERAYADERSWESLQEDESGLLQPIDNQSLKHAQYRHRLRAASTARIQRGLLRYLFIVIDLSKTLPLGSSSLKLLFDFKNNMLKETMSPNRKSSKKLGNKSGLWVACSKCKQHFCLECDMYIHESLHNCPGCESTRHSKIPNINEG
ncbi:hypothetical protein C1H46_038454 [Malus baccata]|uniref:C2H2-type domain-containing protein n=1 Tax=Malus baccata TaxID=106549 RepID=A0A540KP67_MALBA|nr:hypothetical protein C1H46_038454 [Malus baccata]